MNALIAKLDRTLWQKIVKITSASYKKILTMTTERHKKKFSRLQGQTREPGNCTNSKSMGTNVVNLASALVDQDIISVLQKKLNFAVTPGSIPTEEFICNIECGISNVDKDKAEVIRQEAAHILRRSKPPKSNITKRKERL